MKRYIRLGLIAAFVVGALAVNLMPNRDVVRSQVVLSEFINLGADPGAGGLLRLDFLISNAARSARREDRLAHIHPDLLTAHAANAGVSEEALVRRILDPATEDPFDITAVAPPERETLTEQDVGQWRTLVLEESEQETAVGAPAWLLYFNDEVWFYAPILTPQDREILQVAYPEYKLISDS